MNKLTTLTVLATTIITTSAYAQNVLSNSSFENGPSAPNTQTLLSSAGLIPPWVYYNSVYHINQLYRPTDQLHCVRLGDWGVNTSGAVLQSPVLIPATYIAVFDAAGDRRGPNRSVPVNLRVSKGSTFYLNRTWGIPTTFATGIAERSPGYRAYAAPMVIGGTAAATTFLWGTNDMEGVYLDHALAFRTYIDERQQLMGYSEFADTSVTGALLPNLYTDNNVNVNLTPVPGRTGFHTGLVGAGFWFGSGTPSTISIAWRASRSGSAVVQKGEIYDWANNRWVQFTPILGTDMPAAETLYTKTLTGPSVAANYVDASRFVLVRFKWGSGVTIQRWPPTFVPSNFTIGVDQISIAVS